MDANFIWDIPRQGGHSQTFLIRPAERLSWPDAGTGGGCGGKLFLEVSEHEIIVLHEDQSMKRMQLHRI